MPKRFDPKEMLKYFASGIIGFAFSSQISHALLIPMGYLVSYGIGYFSTGIAAMFPDELFRRKN